MADTFKFVGGKIYTLAGSGATSSASSIVLSSFKTPAGDNITMTDFGTTGYGALEPKTSRVEFISFTGVTQNADGTATLTGVTRGLGFTAPYTNVAANQLAHAGSTQFILTNTPQFYNEISGKDNDETVSGAWEFTQNITAPGVVGLDTPTSSDLDHAANIEYVNDIAIQGVADASTTVKGATKLSTAPASPTAPIAVGDNDGRLTGTSGDALVDVTNRPVDNSDTSTTGSGSKIPRGVSGKVDLSWLPDVPFVNLASGENLTAGQPVFINPSDSTVYKAHGYKQIDTTALTLTATAIGRIAKLSNTQYLYLAHNGGTTLTLYLRNITTDSDLGSAAVTTAYDQTKASTVTSPQATVCRLSDTTFIVIYAKTTDNDLYFRTGTVSGSTITFDTETIYPGTFNFCFSFSSVPGASDGKVVFSYLDAGAADGSASTIVPKLAYLTVTTNSVTVTYGISGASVTNGAYNTNVVWTQAAFTKGVAYGLFCTVNGSNIKQIKFNTIEVNTGGTTADNLVPNLESQTGAGVSSGYTQYIPSVVGHDGKIYFGWATNNAANYVNTKTVIEASQSGARIFYQHSTVLLAGDTTVEALSMIGNEMGVVVFGFADSDNNKRVHLYIQKGKIYEFYDYTLLSMTAVPDISLWYSNQKDEIVVGRNTSYIKTWRLPTPVDGMVIANVTSPASAAVYDGVVTTSGLTANTTYFLKDTYTTTGDMDFKGIIPVGQALSTTLINLKK